MSANRIPKWIQIKVRRCPCAETQMRRILCGPTDVHATFISSLIILVLVLASTRKHTHIQS